MPRTKTFEPTVQSFIVYYVKMATKCYVESRCKFKQTYSEYACGYRVIYILHHLAIFDGRIGDSELPMMSIGAYILLASSLTEHRVIELSLACMTGAASWICEIGLQHLATAWCGNAQSSGCHGSVHFFGILPLITEDCPSRITIPYTVEIGK
jgi:hypothetical protein